MPRPVGRPSRFPDAADKFIERIAAGDFTRTAAALAGINVDTAMAWLARGREESSGEFSEFSERYARARGIALQNRIQRIEQVGESDWRCLAWLAERSFKEELCLTPPVPNISVSATANSAPGPPPLTAQQMKERIVAAQEFTRKFLVEHGKDRQFDGNGEVS
jgi:hypothetical protein